MVSRKHKREDKRQRLRSVTRATNEIATVVDAINYIKELKQKIENLMTDEEDMMKTTAETSTTTTKVRVETLERGFLVNVDSRTSFPGLLVSVLETFEEVGLNVVQARVSCSDTFLLQAFGAQDQEEEESINAQMVKKAILNAINIWKKRLMINKSGIEQTKCSLLLLILLLNIYILIFFYWCSIKEFPFLLIVDG
ncbi:hypothetical protein ABFS83_06G124900 [Erythranthe nasuta]